MEAEEGGRVALYRFGWPEFNLLCFDGSDSFHPPLRLQEREPGAVFSFLFLFALLLSFRLHSLSGGSPPSRWRCVRVPFHPRCPSLLPGAVADHDFEFLELDFSQGK